MNHSMPDLDEPGRRRAVVHSRKSIYKGRVFELVNEQITLENGVNTNMDVLHHPGAAAVIAITGGGDLLLIRQYRHALRRYIWEIPAGTRDGNEPVLSCAKRELTEETGFKANTWEQIGEIVPVPGYSDEKITVFTARNLTIARQSLDYDEMIEVRAIPVKNVLEMAGNNEIDDAKTLSGLFLALSRKALIV